MYDSYTGDAKRTFEGIKELIEIACKENNMSSKGLKNTDIYYMNGNDGTMFDWNCNGCLCEFACHYSNDISRMSALRCIVSCDGSVSLYMYSPNEIMPFKEYSHERYFNEDEVQSLCYFLDENRDKKDIWDEKISVDDFNSAVLDLSAEQNRGRC